MEHHFSSAKTFRYYTHGDPEKARFLVYALHGYGQLAAYFIRKFEQLGEDYFIVAPEGMHRFYLKGTTGRVGASWMTKEDRLSDIEDNLKWLNALDDKICGQYTFETKTIVGFSQGGATAVRWFYSGVPLAQNLLIWASVFPADLDISSEIKQTVPGKFAFALGNEDEYFQGEQANEILKFYAENGYSTNYYHGKHTIDTQLLGKILAEMNSF